ncbi:MAG: dephospho-CoA kinase [Fusobacteriaceae bacterium]
MILGLTGGIASGKSTVSNFFKKIGIEVVDADVIATKIRNTPFCCNEIRRIFGDSVFISEYQLDINKFRELIFSDKKKLSSLNNIIHPLVIEYFKKIKNTDTENSCSKKIIIFDIPLLFESNLEYLCDSILLIYTSRENQIKRVQKRNNLTKEMVEKIIDSQTSLKVKLKKSNYVIENSSSLEELEKKIEDFYKLILSKNFI